MNKPIYSSEKTEVPFASNRDFVYPQ